MNKRNTEVKRIESEDEVAAYLDRLKYALQSGQARIQFQVRRQVDVDREERFTNRYTVAHLFPDEDPVDSLKRELASIEIGHYIETVKDKRFTERGEMRVFGRKYFGDDVYIKIRVELFRASSAGVDDYIYIMSFHYAKETFEDSNFPYAGKTR